MQPSHHKWPTVFTCLFSFLFFNPQNVSADEPSGSGGGVIGFVTFGHEIFSEYVNSDKLPWGGGAEIGFHFKGMNGGNLGFSYTYSSIDGRIESVDGETWAEGHARFGNWLIYANYVYGKYCIPEKGFNPYIGGGLGYSIYTFKSEFTAGDESGVQQSWEGDDSPESSGIFYNVLAGLQVLSEKDKDGYCYGGYGELLYNGEQGVVVRVGLCVIFSNK